MDCLNLDYHIKRLVIIAQAKYHRKGKQSKALGITVRQLNSLKKKYNI